MSRRREAADLARVLELSTQQARTVTEITPNYLSSSTNSQTSKDMELIPVVHVDAPAAPVTSASRSEAAAEAMPPPTTAASVTTESIDSGSSAKREQDQSDIQHFTTSGDPSGSILVPATNINTTPKTTATSSNKTTPPSSFPPHLKGIDGHLSSPVGQPIGQKPYASGSSNSYHQPSHVSESEASSNRPIFSPTQLSFPAPDSSAPEQRKVRTYGKTSALATPSSPLKKTGKSAESIAKRSTPSPPIERRKLKRSIPVSSDDEDTGPFGRLGGAMNWNTLHGSKSPQKATIGLTSPDPLDVLAKKKAGTPARIAAVAMLEMSLDVGSSGTNGEGSEKHELSRKKSTNTVVPIERTGPVEVKSSTTDTAATEISVLPRSTLSSANAEPTTSAPSDSVPPVEAAEMTTSTEAATKVNSRKRVWEKIPDVDNSEDEDFAPPGKKKTKPKPKKEPKAKKAKEPKVPKDKSAPVKKGKKVVSAAMVEDEPEPEPQAQLEALPEATEDSASPVVKGSTLPLAPATGSVESVLTELEPETSKSARDPAEPPEPAISIPEEAAPQKQKATKAAPKAKASKGKGKSKAIPKENSPPPKESSPVKSNTPTKSPSKSLTPLSPRQPLGRAPSNVEIGGGEGVSTPIGSISSIGRMSTPRSDSEGTPGPGGVRWKTPRNDLTSVLTKFGGTKRSGMSRKLKIIPLHMKIGPPAKALPSIPKKPQKKVESEDEDEEEEGDGQKKAKVGSKEWLMMED